MHPHEAITFDVELPEGRREGGRTRDGQARIRTLRVYPQGPGISLGGSGISWGEPLGLFGVSETLHFEVPYSEPQKVGTWV